VPTSRLEAFSDGVFAIAITLLVLEVKVPARHGGSLQDQLLHQWPSYLSYLISFLIIGIIWVNHHACLSHIDHVDRAFQFINVGFLMAVAFIPFVSAIVSEFIEVPGDERAAAVLYGTTLTITAIFFNVLWQYAARGRRLIRPDADPREVEGITRSFWPGAFIYASATAVALVSPIASLAVLGGLALFYMLPNRRWARAAG
jgi:uncharacterized membrane protein